MTSDVLLVADVGRGSLSGEAVLTAFRRGLSEHSLVVANADSWPVLNRALRRSRTVVFAGGLLFRSSTQLRRALALATSARLTGRTVCAVVAVGSGRHDRTAAVMARGLARQTDMLVVRDDASAHALMAMGMPGPIRVGADVAWTLLDSVGSAAGETRSGEVMIVEPSPPTQSDDLTDRLTAVTAVLPHDTAVVDAGIDLAGLARRLGDARLVVSREFHVTAAAAAAGVPVLTVADDNSARMLADRLDQPWVTRSAPRSELEQALQRALSVPAPARAVVQAEIAAAEEVFGLLRLVLTGGQMSADSISGLRLESAW